MPVYEYRCGGCGKITEAFQKTYMPDEDMVCPDCGSEKLERLVSAPARVTMSNQSGGTKCCGRTERCETPPCSTDKICRRE